MTLLQKAYNILSKDDIKREKPFIPTVKRPTKAFTFNSFNIPEVRSKKCTKEKLSKVLAFIEMKKYSRYSDGFTVMTISVKNKRLLSMCGTIMSVSNLISYMIQIGLLAEYDEQYQYNAYYSKDNKAKQYVYSYNTETSIKEYCKLHNINKYQIKNNNISIVKKFNESILSFDSSEVRFSSKVAFLKPDNFSTTEFEEYLTVCLYKNYPELEHYQNIADEINETFFSDDLDRQIQFKPSFTWNKGNKIVRKIGIRATNSLVSVKKEKEDGDEDGTIYRDDILKRYGLSYEFDVKSSVPRVTYLLNNGVWMDNNFDFYEVMFKNFIQLCPEETLEWNEETRKIFKSFHMKGYFDTEVMMATHLKFAISKKGKYDKNEWNNLDKVMSAYKQAITSTVGELKYDSEVFFYESCIYLDVLKELLNRNYKVLQIYDGFYLDRECKDIEEIVKNKANNFYNTYISNINKISINNNNTNINKLSINNNTNTNNINKLSINKYISIVKKFKVDDISSLVEQALADEVEFEEAVDELKLLN